MKIDAVLNFNTQLKQKGPSFCADLKIINLSKTTAVKEAEEKILKRIAENKHSVDEIITYVGGNEKLRSIVMVFRKSDDLNTASIKTSMHTAYEAIKNFLYTLT